MPSSYTSAQLAAHLAAGRTVLHNGVPIANPAFLPTDAQLAAELAARKAADLAALDGQIASLNAQRAARNALP